MNWGISIAIILVMAAAFTGGSFLLRFRLYQALSHDATRGDLDRFFVQVDGFAARVFLSPYGRERLRFQALARRGDSATLAEQFNLLMKLKLTDFQRAELLKDGFEAFAGLSDAKHAKRILDEMRAGGFDEHALAAYRRHYDIVLGGKTAARHDLENTYAALTGRRRGYAAYLLSKIYENAGDGRAHALRVEAASLLNVPVDRLDRSMHVNTAV